MICLNCGKEVNGRHWYQSSGKPRCWDRFWTKQREWQLMTLWEEGNGHQEIADEMGVSRESVKNHCARMGLTRVAARRAGMTAREVQRLLGFSCAKQIVIRIERGHLNGRNAYAAGPRLTWFVTDADVRDYLRKPEHWQDWDPDRITDPALKRFALRVRGHVQFLTYREAAQQIGVDPETIGNWITKGWIPAVRRLGTGNHLVRADHVEQIARQYVYGDGAEGLVAA